jgi:hypothetical protein
MSTLQSNQKIKTAIKAICAKHAASILYPSSKKVHIPYLVYQPSRQRRISLSTLCHHCPRSSAPLPSQTLYVILGHRKLVNTALILQEVKSTYPCSTTHTDLPFLYSVAALLVGIRYRHCIISAHRINGAIENSQWRRKTTHRQIFNIESDFFLKMHCSLTSRLCSHTHFTRGLPPCMALFPGKFSMIEGFQKAAHQKQQFPY